MTDETTATTETEETSSTAERDSAGRIVVHATFSFKVPDGHPEAGVKKEGNPYDYAVCDNDQQAVATLKEKEWKLSDLVDDELKSRSRSNAYQKALSAYQEHTVSPEKVRARLINDLIRSKVPEALAIEMIDKTLALAPKAK